VTIVTSVVLVIAISAMTENSVVMKSVENGRMPCFTTSSSAASDSASWSVGTVSAAAIDTST
jgi:hypothetical protein